MSYIKRFVNSKDVQQQDESNSGLGHASKNNKLVFVTVGFKQRDRLNNQKLNNRIFETLPINSAHCKIGTEKYPDAVLKLLYGENKFRLGYGESVSFFKHIRKDYILQPYSTH